MSESEIRKLLNKLTHTNTETIFRQFYYLCYDRFFRIAYYYTHNEVWSQEIVLDAFMKLWEKRDALSLISGIEDYCFILVKNTALNYLDKEERRGAHFSRNEAEPSERDNSPEEVLLSEELFAVYVKALDTLPERCREVFISVKEEKKSYAQVAEEMGISVKTVDAQLQKAIGKLKEAIRGYL
ncbi:RNA polymerase sigma-70 factor [Bacteroides sp. 51]|uniref:RNA polymerase sigma-70 factor n=1 Tax=Bacteroides sp. 51 TaxID=2302938 RepID=UPI0013D3EF1E|nr:RNA polymerase sigma-70 factor [Bacteroides sp. 51]NDV84098.1 RNA polymerase sigma-70 factor [Bacteroides sp. 51]